MLNALKRLQDMNIVHRDIKAENFLVNVSNGEPIVYLADFGFALDRKNLKEFPKGWNTKICGSLHTMAPEILRMDSK